MEDNARNNPSGKQNTKILPVPSIIIDPKNNNDQPTNDKYYFAHIFFFFIGLVHMLPLKFFVTANDYWMYKFRNVSLNCSDSNNNDNHALMITDLQVQYQTAMLISLHGSNVIFTFLTTFFGYKILLNCRIVGSVIAMMLFFMISTVFIIVDTDNWQIEFFVMTMLLIAGANAANAILGISMYTVLANFDSIYLKTYLTGQGLAEIFTALLQITSLAVGLSTQVSALIYFTIGILLIASTLSLTIFINRNVFYRYHMNNYYKSHAEKTITLVENRRILRKIWVTLVSQVLLIFTLSPLHTSVTSLVQSEGLGHGSWNGLYFVPTVTYLLQGVCSLIGRLAASNSKKNIGGLSLMVLNLSRMIVFYPLLMLCNAQPRHYLPVIFPHDYQYITIISAYGLTSGYVTIMCFLNIIRSVPNEELKHGYSVIMNVIAVFMAVTSSLGFLTIKLL